MKKLLLAMLMLTATLTAQSQTINGVKVEGSTSSLIEKFKAKGWKFVKYLDGGVPYLTGSLGSYYNCELFIYSTKAKQAAKVVVYLPEQNSWMTIKERYEILADAYYKKFGEPDLRYEEFEYPYVLGDGYEATAVKTEKANISSVWLDKDNANYEVAISKYMQIKLTCENIANVRVMIRENTNSLF